MYLGLYEDCVDALVLDCDNGCAAILGINEESFRVDVTHSFLDRG